MSAALVLAQETLHKTRAVLRAAEVAVAEHAAGKGA